MANGIISRLKAELGLDSSKFKKGLKDSEKESKSFGKKLDKVGQGITSSFSKIGGAIAGAFAIGKIKSFISESVKLYGVQIEAEQKLKSQIEANGKAANATLADYKRFASGLQSITVIGDETTLSLLQVAESMGASTENSKQAAKGAIALSKAFGISMETAIRGVILAQNGQYEMLQRYIPALRTANSDAEKAAALQDAIAKGFKTATAEAATATGKIKSLSNAWGDLREQIGGAIAESGYFQGILREIGRIIRQVSTDAKDSQLDLIFQDIDIEGKTAEKRLEAIQYWLDVQSNTQDQLIKKEESLANKGADAFKNEKGIFEATKLRAWAIERLSKNNKSFNDSLDITKILTDELKKTQDDIGKKNNTITKSVQDRITELEGLLEVAKKNAANTNNVELFNQGAKDVKKLNDELENLRAALQSMNRTIPIDISAIPKIPDSEFTVKSNVEAPGLPDTLTTEGTIGAQIEEYTGKVNDSTAAMQRAQQNAAAYSSSLSSLGSIARQSGNEQVGAMLDVLSTTIMGVAQIMAAKQAETATVVSSNNAQAISGIVAQGAQAPWFMAPAVIASGLALVASIFSSIGGGGSRGGGSAPVTSIDTRRMTSPSTNTSTRTNTTQQSIKVEVEGRIDNKTIALANKKGTKELNR